VAFGIAETANLAVNLSLKGNFAQQLTTSKNALAKLNNAVTDSGSRAYKAGQQIGTGIKRGAIIAAAAIGSLTALFIAMAKEGQDAANVQKIFAQAIQNSGKVTAAQTEALKAQQEALLNLAGVDDELIKTEQTRLIQMGLTGAQVLKLTPAILDLSKATGIDLLTATKLAGKAAEGNTSALQRYGIMIDKAKAKTDPFGATLDALNKKFGGTTQALSGSLNTKLDVLNEKLKNVREQAGQALLPVLTRMADVIGQKLVPAFGEFINAILPSVIGGLNKVADFLDKGGGTKLFDNFVNLAKTAAPIIQKSAEATLFLVKSAVSLFSSLPDWVQQIAVGAFAVNKLTGGLVTNVVGGIAQFLAKSFTGNMNVTAGVVNVVGGGVPGAVGTAESGAGLIASALKLLPATLFATALVAAAVPIGTAFANALPASLKGPGGAGMSESQTRILAARAAQAGPLASTILDRGGRETGTPGIAGAISGTIRTLVNGLVTNVRSGFSDMVAALKAARGDKAIAAAVKEAVSRVVGKAQGSVGATAQTLSGLRAALKNTHDPALQASIRAAIGKVERKLAGREFAAKQIAIATKALADGKLTKAETTKVKAAINALKDRGLPHAAQVIRDRIRTAQIAQVNASIKAGQIAALAVKEKDLSVSVKTNVSISIREFQNGARIVTNYSGGNLRSGQQG
jgi:hypothetical protein